MVQIHFIEKSSGEFFTNAEREEVIRQIESRWGSARCEVHGETLQLRVWLSRHAGEVHFGFQWQACCDEFDSQMSLEWDKELESLDWNRCHPPEEWRSWVR